MAEGSDLEKTEQPTTKKREDAKKKGQVARSTDLIHATTLCAFLIAMVSFGSQLYFGLISMMEGFLRSVGSLPDFTVTEASRVFNDLTMRVIRLAAPISGTLAITLVSANTLQTGVSFAPERLNLNWERIDPTKGWKKIFNLRGFATLSSSLLKISAILIVLYYSFTAALPLIADLGSTDLREGLLTGGGLVLKTILWVTLAIVVIAILDYLYQRWQLNKDLMMTKQEIKDEHKTSDGDPKQKARIRSLQREIAGQRMMEDVQTADVVVTNPHRIAVALRYAQGDDVAPIVVAKGMNLIAAKIRHEARKHGVPIVENKPLAWALYRTVEVGTFIPEKLYQAVAEVLAFVHRIRGKAES